MGYTTYFNGEMSLVFNDPSKKEEVVTLVNGLATTRRLGRNLESIKDKLPMPIEKYGAEGEFYIDDNYSRETVIDINRPPSTQPGLWLQWIIEEDSETGECFLMWDEGEKFYEFEKWLEYLIENIFIPADAVLNGVISWDGEDSEDLGELRVSDNVLTSALGDSQSLCRIDELKQENLELKKEIDNLKNNEKIYVLKKTKKEK